MSAHDSGWRGATAATNHRFGVWSAAIGVSLCVLVSMERMTASGWNSDDVAWQLAFRTWRPGAGPLVLPENTYVLRIPFLVASDVLLPSRPLQLLLLSTCFNAIGFLLILRFVRYAIAQSLGVRRLSASQHVVSLCAALTPLIASELNRFTNAGTTTRNIEMGLYLCVLRYAHELWSDERDLSTPLRFVGATVGVALLALNDPLFVYSMAAPALVIALALVTGSQLRRAHESGRRLVGSLWPRPIAAVVAGIALWLAVRGTLPRLGVRQRGSDASLDLDDLALHVRNLAEVLLRASGASRVDSSNPFAIAAGMVMLAALVGSLAGIAVLRARAGPPALLAIAWFVALSGLFVATSVAEPIIPRYVIVGFGAIGSAGAVVAVRSRIGTVLAIIVASTAMLSAVAHHVAHRGSDDNASQIALARLVDDLHADGYTSGFAGYWSAQIVTYYTQSDAVVLPITCDAAGRSVPFEWLVDLRTFERVGERRHARSFIVYDEERLLTCSGELIIAQFGVPDRTIGLGPTDERELWLYDSDITPSVITP